MLASHVWGLLLCAAALTLQAQQSDSAKYGGRVSEIVVTHEDGSFTLRDVQLMDQATFRFRARA